MYCDLATVYWELGNENEARATQNFISTISMKFYEIPMTRSKYLCSTECSINDDEYIIGMRVNRELPNRKEGEVLENPEVMKRKLRKCFLKITYEEKNGRFVTTSQTVTALYQFEIRLPHEDLQSDKWYEVVVDIYEDEKKENKKGVHHQMLYFPKENNALKGVN